MMNANYLSKGIGSAMRPGLSRQFETLLTDNELGLIQIIFSKDREG